LVFIKLELKKGDHLISDNFYWRGIEPGNYQALKSIPVITIDEKTELLNEQDQWVAITTLKNNTPTPALMIRLNITGDKTGERILPAFYSDNYFSLLPGESKKVITRVKKEDSRGENPRVLITGFNLNM